MYTFKISTGEMFDGSGQRLGIGWAGQPPYKNDPNHVDKKNVGPLPPGFYTIGPVYRHPRLGPVVMNLEPDPDNQMFNRGDFRIHGASMSDPDHSSEGCIIQVRPVREKIAANLSNDDRLQVVA